LTRELAGVFALARSNARQRILVESMWKIAAERARSVRHPVFGSGPKSLPDLGRLTQALYVPGFRQLGPVPFPVDNAEKAKGLVARGMELVECVRSYVDTVGRADVMDSVLEDDLSLSPDNDHRMRVGMMLQRGVSARLDFEVSGQEADSLLAFAFAH